MTLGKKFRSSLIFIPAFLLLCPTLLACSNKDKDTTYLKVLNAEDYIYTYDEKAAKEGGNPRPDLTVQFEEYMLNKGKKVKVIYDTFDTNENMFNTLSTGKTKYDLICCSEYMIQKLIKKGLVTPLDFSSEVLTDYKSNCSDFIRKQLQSIKCKDKDGKEVLLDNYCVNYMWGTLGIIYNPTYDGFNKSITAEKIHEDVKSYNILWNNEYKKTIAIKDSMRDTYAVGLLHKYQDEFNDLHQQYKDKKITLEDYKNKLSIIFNRGGDDEPLEDAKRHIKEVQEDLIKLRENIFGFEVDSGKEDICTGKIGIDIAWSGDAVYSINKASNPKETTNPFDLYFSLPKEGTNLWFDCWTMQENDHKDVAYEFLNFLSKPENAIQNMDYIGYTSPIKGNDVLSFFKKKYAASKSYNAVSYDVSYFFGDSTYIKIDQKYENRQMAAQFPKADIIDKLMIMKDYGDNNDLIMKMWQEVKHESLPTWAIILFSIEIAVIGGGIAALIIIKHNNKKRRKERRLANAK